VTRALTIRLSPPEHLLVSNRLEFRDRLRRAFELGARLLVVDFAETPYADSSGLGMLLAEKRAANRVGRDLVLENVGGELADMMRITRLDVAFGSVDEDAGWTAPGDMVIPGDGA
jgi:anti-anti-sigma factor